MSKSIFSFRSVCFSILLLLPLLCSAQVVINEFSCANVGDVTDNYGEFEDWMELYNTSGTAFDLSGYYLSDRVTNPMKWQFPAGTTIAANGHLLIWASKRDEVTGGNIHTNFKITQTKATEAIVLSDPAGVLVDLHDIDLANQSNNSRGRTTDGAGTWSVFLNSTPGAANTNPQQEYTAKPAFDMASGYYPSGITLNLSSPDATASIYYTTDGSTPDASSMQYTAPIAVNATTVIRAIAVSSTPDVPESFVETNTYFIGADSHTIPVISMAGDNGISDLIEFGNNFIEPIGSFELFDENQQLIDEGQGEYNKHGNDSWFYDQRGVDFIMRDQLGYNHAVNHQIFPNKNRDEFQRLILKAGANDNYPFEGGAHIRDAYIHTLSQNADLRLDERTYEPCILYVNGQYWGVYEMREKVDDPDFTDRYYDQDEEWIDFIKTWGWTWEEYGSMADWNTLYNYIVTNDMSIPANYDYVKERLNTGSLIDYIIINTHVVCSDWLNYNTAWWRGRNPAGDKKKWRYTLWDMDATFGHYINYTGIPDQSANADPCDNESPIIDDPEGHTELLTALYDNPDFFSDYINRYADLNNTHFTCDYMIDLLDDMVARIAPEMPRQVARWGGSVAGWENAVQDLRDFILTRCTVIDNGIENCYNVNGPYEITIIVEPIGAGTIELSTLDLDSFPWTGDYFGGVTIDIEADANPGFTFINWELQNHTVSPSVADSSVTFTLTQGDTIIAHFVGGPQDITFMIDPPLSGNISIDGTVPASYPFTDAFNVGINIDLEALAEAGFIFDHWSSNGHTFSPDDLTATASITTGLADTITAHFVPAPFELTVVAQPGGIGGVVTVNGNVAATFPHIETFTSGTLVEVEAIAPNGYEFGGWQLNNHTVTPGTSPEVGSFNITANDTLVAIFNLVPFNITVMVDPATSGSVSVNGSMPANYPWTDGFAVGTDITFAATAANGYEFDYWTINNHPIANLNDPNAQITVFDDDTLTAHFTAVPMPITIVIETEGGTANIDGISVSGIHTEYYTIGTEISLEALADEDYQFSYWASGNNSLVSPNSPNTSFIIAAGDTIRVFFELKPIDCTAGLPNAFSPNGDRNNDEFKWLSPCQVRNYQMVVYNRWGSPMYQSNDITLGWDGTYKGNNCDTGVYVWYAVYELLNENSEWEPRRVQGNITLVR